VALALVVATACSQNNAPPDQNAAAVQPVPASLPPPVIPSRLTIAPDLPPLPPGAENAVRPFEIVRAAYEFAARHPEVLKFVPCFCGCERGGHKHNADCFIASRDSQNRVTWETHALGCEICLDVAQMAMQLHNTGASVAAIRDAVEARFAAAAHGNHTPTPPAPRGGSPSR
jgi:hypothetical protein